MKDTKYYSLAMYYLHEILLICGKYKKGSYYFINDERIHYVHKGAKLNNCKVQTVTQKFKQSEAGVAIMDYLEFWVSNDIFENLKTTFLSNRKAIISDMYNILLILTGKNTTCLDIKFPKSMIDRSKQNKIFDKFAVNTTDGIFCSKLHKLHAIIPYHAYNFNQYDIVDYLSRLLYYNVSHNLIKEAFSFEQISYALTKYYNRSNILDWMRIAPLYAAVYKQNHCSPIHRMALDALGLVMHNL